MPTDVVFVFLGERLPRYARASLEIAHRSSGLRPLLIGPAKLLAPLDKGTFSVLALEDFYSSKRIGEASSSLLYSSDFRDNFWLKTLERLFVAEQYFAQSGKPYLFHAELDQLLFQADGLVSRLMDSKRKGVFVPFHSPNTAIASVLFSNSPRAMGSLIDFACSGNLFESEMHLIAEWARNHPGDAHALPTAATEILGPEQIVPPGVDTLSKDEIGGIVDAAQLGQWVGGIDPRNVAISEVPKSKFVDAPADYLLGKPELRSIHFSYGPEFQLRAEWNDKAPIILFNLHLHSKLHSSLSGQRGDLRKFVEDSNNNRPRSFQRARAIQIFSKFGALVRKLWQLPQRVFRSPSKLRPFLLRNINSWLNRRPSSYPLLSGDTFRALADHVYDDQEVTDGREIAAGDVVFCQSEFLNDFFEKVYPCATIPFSLILGNSDRNWGGELLGSISEAGNVNIHCQNLYEEVPNCLPLPIGLENAWWAKNGIPSHFSQSLFSPSDRLSRVMAGFTISTNPNVRLAAYRELRANSVTDFINPMSPKKHRRALEKYMFVASPPGNGLDTHRTWEAMYLGCVPIVQSSYMTRYFEDLGLPIWVVQSYSELETFSEKDLGRKYAEIAPRFSSEALHVNFWMERIKTHEPPRGLYKNQDASQSGPYDDADSR